MTSYSLSKQADADIDMIAEDSLRQWGAVLAERYILGLHRTFQTLAEFPDLGRDASNIRAGYRRVEAGSHTVFYRKTPDGVLIVRVLHQRMDFIRHL